MLHAQLLGLQAGLVPVLELVLVLVFVLVPVLELQLVLAKEGMQTMK